jgi:ABC-type multidrug transport system fused ATPase/permease subunit
VIHGPSGSGKSLILASIIGEALVLEGSVIVPKQSHNYDAAEEFDLEDWILPGSLAYCAQVTWIEHASIKDNILFGLQMIQDRYQAVLAASALQPDLEILPDGDLTEVGAQGINLSGGQRWRLAFARALYSRAEILVLDDIFSAVDSHVGTHLLETLTGDLCKNRTRILATHHASRCLPRAAFAVRLGNDGYADSTNIATGHRQLGPFPSMIFRDGESTKRTEEKQGGSGEEAQKEAQARKPKVFVDEEGRQDGAVRWWTYSQYMSSSGGIWTWTSIVALVIISQLALLGRGWWLKVWTSADERPPKTAGPQHTGQTSHGLTFYLGLYIGISLVAALMEAVKCGFVYAASLRASHSLFQHLLYTVLRAKLRWLDTVPVGRILNRFTADFALVDTKIPGDTHTLLSSTFALGVVFTAGLMLSPYMAISSVAVSLLALMFTARYLPGARELRRLESTTKSPILELCGASLSGLGTIRAFGVTNRYSQRMKDFVDDYSSSGQASHLVTQWLSVRIGMLGALYAFSVAITIAALPGINASKAGLALVFALEYGKNMEEAIRRYAMLQLDMNATERILEYAEMQHEHEGKKTSPPASWPQSGQISFQGVFASYAVDLPPIIKGVSIDIEARKRVGIVGRTGAGKSSLALTMFRFIELLNGKITIDGVDISQVSLKRLRSKMAIIPQDPVLFSGTIRSNLDPFSEYSDEVLRDSLDKVHLTSQSRGQATLRRLHANPFDNLESQISDDGLNLSQGQRQLLCLARATLVQARIMVLDEATSAVDQETDVLIQATIRESFLDTTLLVIAHRLSTVADFDRIMVIHDGRIEEFGDPRSLYRAKGAFWRLANDSNDRAQLLRMLST